MSKPVAAPSPGNVSASDLAEEVFFSQDQVFLSVDLDGLPGVVGENHIVPFVNVDREPLAVVPEPTGSNSDDRPLLRGFLGLLRDHDPPRARLLRARLLHQHSIAQRFQYL